MRPCIFLCLISFLTFRGAVAQKNSLPLVHLPGGRVSVHALMDSIERSSHCAIFYDRGALDPERMVMTQNGYYSIHKIMEWLGAGEGFSYSFINSTIFITARADNLRYRTRYRVRVSVTDEDNQPLPGAALRLSSSGKWISTGQDGTAVVEARRSTDTLLCYAVERMTDTIALCGQPSVKIKMRLSDISLSEVVVLNQYARSTRLRVDGGTGSYDYATNERTPVADPLLALSGRVPGLLVTQSSGVHGAAISVNLRGRNSIFNGRDPYYIIDGVPFATGNLSLSNIGSGNSAGSLSPFSFLDLYNVESIEVLKDAAATAVYGSRGANGVVLITTRMARPGRPSLSVGYSAGVSQVTRLPRLMNTSEYMAMRKEALRNDGLAADAQHAPELLQWDTAHSNDWGKYFIGATARSDHYHASITGGSPFSNYFLGANYLKEADVFVTHPVHGLSTITGNYNYRSRDGRLKIGWNGIFGSDDNQQYTTDITRLQYLVPNTPSLTSADGRLKWHSIDVRFVNPLSFIYSPYTAHSHNFLTGVNAVYKIDTNFSIRNDMGWNSITVGEESAIPVSAQEPSAGVVARDYFASTRYSSWILEPRLEYQRHFRQWKVDGTTGASLQGSNSYIRATSTTSPAMMRVSDNAYHAVFAKLHLGWKDTYIMDITARKDKSTRPGQTGKYGNFGAVGVAWIFSALPACKRLLPFISFGKLRGSFGVTGNDQIGDNYYAPVQGTTAFLPTRNVTGQAPVGGVNGDITWEAVAKQEIGLELGMFNDRLMVTTAWYRNHSLNQLLPDSFATPRAGLVRFSNYPVVVENSGWEFNLTAKIIANRDFIWTAAFNASLPVNKLTAFPGLAASSFRTILIEGRSLSELQGLNYKGVDPQTGVFQFRDLNGDNRLTDADRIPVGKLDPVFFGGLLNSLSWHRWRFSALIEARIQRGIDYQAAIYANNPPGSILSGFYSNETTRIMDRWRRPGIGGAYQRLTTNVSSVAGQAINNYLSSSAILTDASFARLKTVSLFYSFPQSFLRKLPLRNFTFFLQGENLWTLTRYQDVDPEIQSIMVLPPAKRVLVGVEVKF